MGTYIAIITWVVIINIFTAGAYFVLRGSVKKRSLRKKMVRVPAVMKRTENSFRGMITWNYMGARVDTVKRGVYILPRRERLNLYYHPESLRTELDIWTNNGTGKILAGVSMMVLSVGLAMTLWF